MKVTKYIVISEPNLTKFQAEVQQAIDQNWQPHGSLQVTNENHMIWYSQSMVQYISAAMQKKATVQLAQAQATTQSVAAPPAAAPATAPIPASKPPVITAPIPVPTTPAEPKPSPVAEEKSEPKTPAPLAEPPASVPAPAPQLAELPPPVRPPVRSKPVAPVIPLAPFPSQVNPPKPVKAPEPVIAGVAPVRAKLSPRLRSSENKNIQEIPPLSNARPVPASSNFSPQFLWAKNKRYTIFDAVELPGGIAQLSCTVAEGDFERLTLSVGKEAELDEKGRITARVRVRSVSRRGTMAVIEVSLI